MGKILRLLEVSFCIGSERKVVVGILPISQTFTILTSKKKLLFAILYSFLHDESS